MDHETIGELLLAKRKENKLSRKAVFDAVGINEAVLIRYEGDISYPKEHNLKTLCDFYNISYDDVVALFPKPDERKIRVREHSSDSKFAEMLREARIAKEIKQTTIAAKVEKSSVLVSAWEVGRILPSRRQLPDIADAYGIDYDELLYVWNQYAELNEKPHTAFAIKLRNARLDAKLTQHQAAQLIGVPPNKLCSFRDFPG